jgi:hypothetical protein
MRVDKFISKYDLRINHGFSHAFLHAEAEKMGFGPVGSSVRIENITSDAELTWDGRPGDVIGWWITVCG